MGLPIKKGVKPSMIWDIVNKAVEPLREQKIRFGVVGSAALWLQGYDKVKVGDIDVLVEKVPEGIGPSPYKEADAASVGSTAIEIDGVKVDYIFADETREAFLKLPFFYVGTYPVPVLSPIDVLKLKRQAGRPKDFKFLADWACGVYL